MLSRNDNDPTEIPWALGRVFLVDYSPQEGFRYRLAGAEIASAFGRANMAGLRFSDFLPPDSARFVEQRWMPLVRDRCVVAMTRSEEHTSELQSLMRLSYAVFCLKKKTNQTT